tara:strand:- start:2194 stop:2403 length:210 start_codon:yes stop_codon:yes gene_type:complete
MMNQALSSAQGHCANWNAGKCLGAMLRYDKKGKAMHMWIDENLAGKDCTVTKGCDYFNHIVTPSLNTGY